MSACARRIGAPLALALLALALAPLPARADGEVIQLKTVKFKGGAKITLKNKKHYPVTIRFTADKLINVRPSKKLPLIRVIPPRKTVTLVRLKVRNPKKGWSLGGSKVVAEVGSLKAKPDLDDYQLPYAPGKRVLVGQAFNGAASHKGKNAIDFSIPRGKPIRAARAGVVVDVIQHFTQTGMNPALKKKGNKILVLQADGTIAVYAHIQTKSAMVKIGDEVQAGTALGLCGDVGYASGPHLHFEVTYVRRKGTKLVVKTVPVTFATSMGKGVTLVANEKYRWLRAKPKTSKND